MATNSAEYDILRQKYEAHLRDQSMSLDVEGRIRGLIAELEGRFTDMESFIKYAADVDPNFKKLLAGWQACKRIGLKG